MLAAILRAKVPSRGNFHRLFPEGFHSRTTVVVWSFEGFCCETDAPPKTMEVVPTPFLRPD